MASMRKPGRGRARPRSGATPPGPSSGATPSPEKRQVGRRPSPPGLLLTIGVLWVAAGVVVFTRVHATWRLIPAIVGAGIGLYYLRGAATTVLRRDELRRETGDE